MSTQHTQGPWRTGDAYNTVFGPKTGKPSPETICTIAKGNEANARLIAAAPDMLKMLTAVIDCDFEVGNWPLLQDSIRAVYAKATGGQP